MHSNYGNTAVFTSQCHSYSSEHYNFSCNFYNFGWPHLKLTSRLTRPICNINRSWVVSTSNFGYFQCELFPSFIKPLRGVGLVKYSYQYLFITIFTEKLVCSNIIFILYWNLPAYRVQQRKRNNMIFYCIKIHKRNTVRLYNCKFVLTGTADHILSA